MATSQKKTTPTYDLVVIGAGPAGYVGAIRAAQLGLSVLSIDKRATLGGTCLNVGCIPSKALLHSSELYAQAQHDFAAQGIVCGDLSLDMGKLQSHKDGIVDKLTKGIASLYRKNAVQTLEGTARLESTGAEGTTITVDTGKTTETVIGRAVLLATGSESAPLAGVSVDERKVVTSTGALALAEVPKTLAVIGAGVIGLELGSLWSRLGAAVTVFEYVDGILPGQDREMASQFQKIMQKQGLTFRFNTQVLEATPTKKGARVRFQNRNNGDGAKPDETEEFSTVLLAVGRRPYTESLNLASVGIAVDANGLIPVDAETYETNCPRIFAVGDCVRGPQLAHKASEEAVVCVERLVGQCSRIHLETIPSIVYTQPEFASVGASEDALKQAQRPYRKGMFPLLATSRSRTTGQTAGAVKLLADAETDAVLGGHIIAPNAGELIQEIVTVMAFGGSAEDIICISHGHPTISEALKEAALAVHDRAIHI